MLSRVDTWLSSIDHALRTLSGANTASRALPRPSAGEDGTLSADQRRLSGALMRVNHVGEVCAQALYEAQAITAQNDWLRKQFSDAAREEADHLAWTEERLRQLGARASLLNPLWYAGAFCVGLAAGRLGDRASLGFVVETERQVEAHLQGHLERLPAIDASSRAIVDAMKTDEAAHAVRALQAGGADLPAAVKALMRAAARVMTTTAHYL